ncbi:MAG: hypothetical protein L0Z68_10795, partial [Gammaproteobacteria bacterium]|nr:hypothetical protein [Gammaproteobacteria bacterium]
VLGMPPAFNLSQDQTLHLKVCCCLMQQYWLDGCNLAGREVTSIDVLIVKQPFDVSAHTDYVIRHF